MTVFQEGDVMGNERGIFVVPRGSAAIGIPVGQFGWTLAYRPSVAALSLFARPESVEFMRKAGDVEGVWFYVIDGQIVAFVEDGHGAFWNSRCPTWESYDRGLFAVPKDQLVTYLLERKMLRPVCAKRHLEREAAKQTNAPRTGRAALEFFGVDKAVPGSDRTGVVAWLPTDAKPAGERLTGVRIDPVTAEGFGRWVAERAVERMRAALVGVGDYVFRAAPEPAFSEPGYVTTVKRTTCPCGAELPDSTIVAGHTKCGDCRRETKLGILRQSLDRRISAFQETRDPFGRVWSTAVDES